jgi:hypothetical protein
MSWAKNHSHQEGELEFPHTVYQRTSGKYRTNCSGQPSDLSTFPPGKRCASIWDAWEVKDIIAMLSSCNVTLLKRAAITPIDIEGRRYIPVDVDVSTFDNGKSHKEGVGRTYMGTDGYAPIFSYIGTEGYMLDCELKSWHAAQPEGDTRFSVPEPADGQGAGAIASGPVPAGLGQRRHRYDRKTRSAGLFFPDQAESPP